MSLSRGVATLLAYLVVLPAAMVVADVGQRGLDTEEVPAGPLREGAYFAYDISALSDPSQFAATAPSAFEIEVGELHYDSEDRPYVKVVTSRDTLPWDRLAREPWTLSKKRIDGAVSYTLQETVAVKEGRARHSAWEWSEEQSFASGGTGYDLGLSRARHLPGGDADGTVAALAAYMGETWRYEDRTWDERLGRAASDVVKGTFDGRTVYGRTTTWSEDHDDVSFGCDLAFPPLPHQEWPAVTAYEDEHVSALKTRTVWRDPALPVPVAVDCHASFAAQGLELGHIRVVATLHKAKSEGRPIDLAWNEPAVGRPFGPLAPAATSPYGVPADGSSSGVDFRFPLSAAWSAVRSWQDPTIDAFASHQEPPYVLARAIYWPGDAVATCDSVPRDLTGDCQGAAEPLGLLGGAPSVNLRPRWEIVLENAEHDLLALLVERNMTSSGQTVEDRVERLWSDAMDDAADSMYDIAPEHVVPVEAAFAHWMDQAGINAEEWENDPHAYLGYGPRTSGDQGTEPMYRFWDPGGRSPAAKGGIGDPGDAGDYYEYRASDGALLESGSDAYEEKQVTPRAASAMPPLAYTVPTPVAHAPTAAIVVAVGVTAGFAGFHFSETARTWIRRLAFLPLFTKLSRDRVLEHRTRESMVHFIDGNPGVGTEEVRRQHDIGWGTAVYHLNALEEKGILVSIKQGGARHWFSTRSHDRRAMAAHAILRSPASKRAYDAIAAQQGLTQQELAAALGVTHGAVIFQVRKLVQAGLVKKQRDGRFVRYFVGESRPMNVPISAE